MKEVDWKVQKQLEKNNTGYKLRVEHKRILQVNGEGELLYVCLVMYHGAINGFEGHIISSLRIIISF